MLPNNANTIKPIFLALASGVLLIASWPMSPLVFLIFVAWLPLIHLVQQSISNKKFFLYIYSAMLIWNVGTTWWVWNSTAPGSVAAFLANSALMCIPLLGFKKITNRLGKYWGYAALVSFWMCFEFIHLQDWGLSWPWLTLGNVFATNTQYVQWYEYTGVAGGTLWIFLVNILLYEFITAVNSKRKRAAEGIALLTTLIAPIILSFLLLNNFQQKNSAAITVTAVQPNIDPYDKVNNSNANAMVEKLLKNSKAAELIVWPETALFNTPAFEESQIANYEITKGIFTQLSKTKSLLFTGVEAYNIFNEASKTKYAEKIKGTENYYESYNGAVLLDSNKLLATYHKTMLVPGVETLPWFLGFMKPIFEKFGGSGGGYAKQSARTPITVNKQILLAPSICYESIYGGFMAKYFNNGANLLVIITNDGWWKNTPGHLQHFAYARLRAIENRTWVARSANTGISGFIDPMGNVKETLTWEKEGYVNGTVYATNNKTFYSKFGDWLYWLAAIATISILLTRYIFLRKIIKPKSN
jgi:apolipoprotein N-acyltransferase